MTSYCFLVGQSQDIQDSECFDLATGGEGPLRFWGIRGRNLISKYGATGCEAAYVLTSMVSLLVQGDCPFLIAGDSGGE
jgi:hypothetical protein